ncbi:uncharacterized protein LOC142225607 [Haematobia irritans]|uniref:uncharacterized protein LOC142225607 n=1 Tax=Haematobia irritans TaxID=7368 RepID=UPI003F506C00
MDNFLHTSEKTKAIDIDGKEQQKTSQDLVSPAVHTNILDLNDDCLLEILQYLSVQDTFAIIDTFNNRMNDIAYKRISQVKTLIFSLREPPQYTTDQLKIIGKHLKSLSISVGYSLSSDLCISGYLGPLCYYGSIENLTLNYVNFNEDYLECILKLASNLRILDLNFCQLTDELLQPILENCNLLETLSIIGNYGLRGKSLHHIRSSYLKTITLEMNDLCKEEVEIFEKNVGNRICLHIYNKGRYNVHKGHFR